MQRWDYRSVLIYVEPRIRTETGREVDGAPETVSTWCTRIDGEPRRLDEVLAELGAEGWEMVTSAPAEMMSGGDQTTRTYHPMVWLFFKRPGSAAPYR